MKALNSTTFQKISETCHAAFRYVDDSIMQKHEASQVEKRISRLYDYALAAYLDGDMGQLEQILTDATNLLQVFAQMDNVNAKNAQLNATKQANKPHKVEIAA